MSVTQNFVIKSSVKATASVIFLHGLGDSGAGWSHEFDSFKKPHIRYIFPNAPSIPVTLNAGFVMPAWYDLKGLNPNAEEDEIGIENSAKMVRDLIKEEQVNHGISSDRVILGGFSMGGSLALFTGLTLPTQLAGIVALSSWLPLHKKFTDPKESHHLIDKQRCPIFQGHGEDDQMVPCAFGKLTNSILKSGRKGLDTSIALYPKMGHQSCDTEMDDVKNFIDKYLPA